MNIKELAKRGSRNTWWATITLYAFTGFIYGWYWAIGTFLAWSIICVVVNSIWEKSFTHGFRRAFGISLADRKVRS